MRTHLFSFVIDWSAGIPACNAAEFSGVRLVEI
jgi:hypothetical protein